MDSTQKLFDLISLQVPLTEEDKSLLVPKTTNRSFKKGDIILRLEQKCVSIKFVNSGIYRVYQIENGKEITSYFNYEKRNPFVASFVSLLTHKPSKEIIECIVEGELLSISYENWNALYKKSERFNTFGRIIAEYNYVLAMERIESLQYHNAADRYKSFIQIYPNLLNLIPHHYIASYLVAP